MKFIKFTGSKESSPTSTKSSKQQHGIFECPICHSHVEKSLSEGRRNKSCGKKECRREAGNFRGTLTRRDNTITSNRFYTNIATLHSLLKRSNIPLCEDWKVLSNFFNDVIKDYEDIRNTNGVKVTHHIDENATVINNTTFSFKPYIYKSIKHREYKVSVKGDFSFIYLLRNGASTKIGIADNVAKRIKSLQTGNPLPIEEVYSMYTHSARAIEAYLHYTNKDKRLMGEWFNLSEDDVDGIISYLEDYVADMKWTGEKVIEHQSIYTATHLTKVSKAKGYIPQGPAPETPYEPATIPEVPKEMYARKKSDSPLYNSWKTMLSKKKKGFTYVAEWDDFFKFEKDLIEKYNACKSPVLTVVGTHYDNDSTNFVSRTEFSSKKVSVVAYKDEVAQQIYPSTVEAAKAVGGLPGHITACCKGKRKQHAGYSWKYLDNKE